MECSGACAECSGACEEWSVRELVRSVRELVQSVRELVRSVRECQDTKATGVLFSSILDGGVGQRDGAFSGRSRGIVVVKDRAHFIRFISFVS